MKRIIILLLGIMVFSSSCENTTVDNSIELDDNQSKFESLKSDQRFTSLVENVSQFISKASDLDEAKLIVNKENIDYSDIEKLSRAMGFKNAEQYTKALKTMTIDFESLEKDYKLSSIDKKELKVFIVDLISQDFDSNLKITGCNCGRIARNCIATATAGAVIGHIGCGTVDITVIGGVICHSAVAVLQIATSDNCLANQENCESNC